MKNKKLTRTSPLVFIPTDEALRFLFLDRNNKYVKVKLSFVSDGILIESADRGQIVNNDGKPVFDATGAHFEDVDRIEFHLKEKPSYPHYSAIKDE